jgi:prophage maintenance system killer protein
MAKKALTPAALARELGCDVDDVLLMLWDHGIEYPTTPDSHIRSADMSRARSACGVVALKERLSVDFWSKTLGMDRQQFIQWASGLGVAISPNARRLPKGVLSKIERVVPGGRTVRPEPTAANPSRSVAVTPLKTLEWRISGHHRDAIRHLSADEIESIHFQIAEDFRYTSDPIAPAGVRSQPLLDSAAGRPTTGMGGEFKYPTVEMAAAALTHSVIHNHPFFNGNKRTALVSMLAFLDENGLVLNSSQSDVFRWTIRIASHKLGADEYRGDPADTEVMLMTQWLVQHCRNVEAGERVITFAELRRRLQAFECEVFLTGNGGGRAVVERPVVTTHSGLFGKRERVERKRYYLPYGGEGRQVSRSRIKQMRRDLHLSDEFGVDSASFYGNDRQPVDAFIAQYRKTLTRLARL